MKLTLIQDKALAFVQCPKDFCANEAPKRSTLRRLEAKGYVEPGPFSNYLWRLTYQGEKHRETQIAKFSEELSKALPNW